MEKETSSVKHIILPYIEKDCYGCIKIKGFKRICERDCIAKRKYFAKILLKIL